MAAHVALIADTHLPRGSRQLPCACVRRLREAELIVHAGDIVALAELEQLTRLGPPVVAVRGNVDEPAVAALLPVRREFELGGARVGLVHDAGPARGRLPRLRRAFPGCEAVVFGHSHVPLHEREGGFQIFNPGSPTDRRRQPQRTMGLLRAGSAGLEFELISLGA